MLNLKLNEESTDTSQVSYLTEKDSKKIEKYFKSFDYLNNDELQVLHLKKITHVGISSLKQGSLFISEFSNYLINQINKDFEQITFLMKEFNQVIEQYDSKKTSLFSRKQNIFEIYHQTKDVVSQIVEKLQQLYQRFQIHLEQIEITYIPKYSRAEYMLNRDMILLTQFNEFISNHSLIANLIMPFAKEIELISKNIVYQKQLVSQKYQLLMTIKHNIEHYIQHIQYISNVSQHTMSAMLDLEILSKLPKTNNEQNQMQAETVILKMKEALKI